MGPEEANASGAARAIGAEADLVLTSLFGGQMALSAGERFQVEGQAACHLLTSLFGGQIALSAGECSQRRFYYSRRVRRAHVQAPRQIDNSSAGPPITYLPAAAVEMEHLGSSSAMPPDGCNSCHFLLSQNSYARHDMHSAM